MKLSTRLYLLVTILRFVNDVMREAERKKSNQLRLDISRIQLSRGDPDARFYMYEDHYGDRYWKKTK
jgi:hypothetical protein